MLAKCRNAQTEAVRNVTFSFEKNLVDGLASYPKQFWKYVHSKTKKIGGKERSDGSLTLGEIEMTEILNNFFSSVLLMKIYLMCHHWNQAVWGIFCHWFFYPWTEFESSCVILIHLNLAVAMIHILACSKRLRKVYFNYYF